MIPPRLVEAQRRTTCLPAGAAHPLRPDGAMIGLDLSLPMVNLWSESPTGTTATTLSRCTVPSAAGPFPPEGPAAPPP